MYDLLLSLRKDYGPPAIYVTENGAAFGDLRAHDGSVRDPERRDHLEEHIAAIGRALGAGVPIAGYFVWSFLDNFELGTRLQQALRYRLRRLSDARPDPEVELLLVPGLHRRGEGVIGGGRLAVAASAAAARRRRRRPT